MFKKSGPAILTILLALFSATAHAEDTFRVQPYILTHTQGHYILNFQFNEDTTAVIEEGGQKLSPQIYKKREHYQIDLRSEKCGVKKEVRIKSEKNEVLFANNYPASPCAAQNSAKEYVFGFISDTQQYRERHEAIAKVIATHHKQEPMQFMINGGDVVQTGSLETDWIDYINGGKAYLSDIPQIAAIGNHDYRIIGHELPPHFQKYMRWPDSPRDGNLFFEFPDFQLIIFNSNFNEMSKTEREKMWVWLEEAIVSSSQKNLPVIIASHHPVYSSSLNRFTSMPVRELREKLVPLVERYNIKLVLGGHTHMYERSLKDRINYVVAGPAGGRVNGPTFKNPYRQTFDADALTFTKFRLKGRTARMETYNQDNVLIDQLEFQL